MEILKGHTSFETAYEVKDYPYGYTLRTSMFYWIETVAKKGDRVCTCTINPKNGRLNATKKGTFRPIAALYLDENGHVQNTGISGYAKPEEVAKFVEAYGEENFNPEQLKQLKHIRGEKVEGESEPKAFSVKWEKDGAGKCDELKITFDRPDGVSLMEIFEAMKSVNQERLNEVFGEHKGYDGLVRICVRKGRQLGVVKKETYTKWLAMEEAKETTETK